MMGASAAWAAWVAIGVSVAGYLIRDGVRRGRIDQVLESVRDLLSDHEGRIRELEARGPRHARQKGSGRPRSSGSPTVPADRRGPGSGA